MELTRRHALAGAAALAAAPLLPTAPAKAAAPMAGAVEEVLGDRISGGAVTVKYGYTAPTAQVTLHEAGHPVPDSAGVAGTQAMIALLEDAGPDDLVLCLISGGGSALMPLPVPGVTLAGCSRMKSIVRSSPF